MTGVVSVDQLTAGDHACLTFTDAAQRLDILAAFVADGLDRNEKVICIAESTSTDELGAELIHREVPVADPLTEGQLAVVGSDQAWAGTDGPDATTLVGHLAGELSLAEDAGYQGLRVTADMSWAARPRVGAEQLLSFEAAVSALFISGRLTTVCQYDRQSFDPVTLAFAARVHPRTVAATVYHEDPVLRICRQHMPPGVRVAGELDFTRVDPLRLALAEAMRLDRDIHLNLSSLQFIDAGAAAVILQVAAALPPPRRMVVVCQDAVDRVLTAAGASDVPAMRMLVRDAER